MAKVSFLSLKNANQLVDSKLCILFISLFCFWTVLYYLVTKAEAIAESYNPYAEYRIKTKVYYK